MSLHNRLAKVEAITLETAHALVFQVYGVTAADLDAIKTLTDLINTRPDLFDHKLPADILAAFTGSVTQAIQEHIDDPEGNTRKDLVSLWRRAGLDIHKQPKAQRDVMATYEPPHVVTIDTLLDLDRQVYERCKKDGKQ